MGAKLWMYVKVCVCSTHFKSERKECACREQFITLYQVSNSGVVRSCGASSDKKRETTHFMEEYIDKTNYGRMNTVL